MAAPYNFNGVEGAPSEKKFCKRGHECSPENTYVFPGGKTRECKLCRRIKLREYQRRNRKCVNAKSREWRRAHLSEVRKADNERSRQKRVAAQAIANSAKAVPCADCGATFPPYVMDFDHRDPVDKLFAVGTGIGQHQPLDLLWEIEKCDVVCANCHRIRTHKRKIEDREILAKRRLMDGTVYNQRGRVP